MIQAYNDSNRNEEGIQVSLSQYSCAPDRCAPIEPPVAIALPPGVSQGAISVDHQRR